MFPEHKQHHTAEQKGEINLTHAKGSIARGTSGELSKVTAKCKCGGRGGSGDSQKGKPALGHFPLQRCTDEQIKD